MTALANVSKEAQENEGIRHLRFCAWEHQDGRRGHRRAVKSGGHEAELVSIKDGGVPPTAGDLLFIGSPTRGRKHTKEAKKFIDKLDAYYWNSRPAVLFDTLGPLGKSRESRERSLANIEKDARMSGWTAAETMKKQCLDRGIMVHPKAYHLPVGMWGPLAEEGAEMAKGHAHDFLATLK